MADEPVIPSEPVYYHAQSPDAAQKADIPDLLEGQEEGNELDVADEMVYMLFGSLLIIPCLLALRNYTSEQNLPLNVFLLAVLILGMGFSVKGYIMQRDLLQRNKKIDQYRKDTYDNQFNSQKVTVTSSDRKALILSFSLTLTLGFCQLAALLYAVSLFALNVFLG
jgi:hypothetical protein